MGKALEVVNRFYDLTNKNKQAGEGELAKLVAKDITFYGPLMKASGAGEYIRMNEQFLKFHRGTRMLKQFENGSDVCSIYEMTLATPAGGTFPITVADWIRVSGAGLIAEQRIYYDPRDFARAFGL